MIVNTSIQLCFLHESDRLLLPYTEVIAFAKKKRAERYAKAFWRLKCTEMIAVSIGIPFRDTKSNDISVEFGLKWSFLVSILVLIG